MYLEELLEQLNNINSFMIISNYSMQDTCYSFREFFTLKIKLSTVSLIKLSSKEIQELDVARFNILRNLYLLEIELRKNVRKDIKGTIFKLEELYRENGGEFKYERNR